MTTSTIRQQWENLHSQERFRPLYPHEAVVRFLMSRFPRDKEVRQALRVLDVGCGAGRHTLLFAEHGFQTFATDFSMPGLIVTRERLKSRGLTAKLVDATMHQLPFADASFDGVVSFGVLEYNDWTGAQTAVTEIHRILKPGGKASVVTRTASDYRFGKGKQVDAHSFILNIAETNERDMLMCFLDRDAVTTLFQPFSNVTVDRIELTTDEWRVDSDWIITAVK